jgi:superfamily II RNA helicase
MSLHGHMCSRCAEHTQNPQQQPGLLTTLFLLHVQGASFASICSLTEAYEGSIIRATRRLDELMGQLQVSHADERSTSSKIIIDITVQVMAASQRSCQHC